MKEHLSQFIMFASLLWMTHFFSLFHLVLIGMLYLAMNYFK